MVLRSAFILLLCLLSGAIEAQGDTMKVLFVGNSQTTSGGIADKFENLAISLGEHVVVRSHSPGGAGLRTHLTDGAFYSILDSQTWDYVVLQPAAGEQTQTVNAKDIIDITDTIYSRSSCSTQVLFYEVARHFTYNTSYFSLYNKNQDAALQYNLDLRRKFDLPFAPVGEITRRLFNENQNIYFWISESDHHIGPYGGYLAACIFYNSIFRRPSVGGAADRNLKPQICLQLQQASDSMVMNGPEHWHIPGNRKPSASFEFHQSNEQFHFINHSNTYGKFEWRINGKLVSTARDLQALLDFSSLPHYDVELRAFLGCEVDDTSASFNKSDLQNSFFSVYPVPASRQLFITNPKDASPAQIQIYSPAGKLILKQELEGLTTEIDLMPCPRGPYLLRYTTAQHTEVLRIIKK